MSNYIVNQSEITLAGSNSSDEFTVINGTSLVIDGSTGLDFLVINVSDAVDISYDTATAASSIISTGISGGVFSSFESITIQGGVGNDVIRLLGAQGSYPLKINGGEGVDKLILPYTHTTYENFEISKNESLTFPYDVSFNNGSFSAGGFEIIQLNDGYFSNSSMRRNLGFNNWNSVDILMQLDQIIGTKWTQDYLQIDLNNDIEYSQYLWVDENGTNIGLKTQSSSKSLLVNDFEFIAFFNGPVFVPAGPVTSISYQGGTLYSVGALQFITYNAIEVIQINDLNSLTFQLLVADIAAPTVSTFSPADGTNSVAVASNIVLTFNESVAKGTGSIQVRAGSATGTVFETFDVATSSRLTFLGSTLTIDPTSSLVGGTKYYVTLASGSVKDTAGNSYTGTTAYVFTTISTTTPTDGSMTSSAANEAFSGDSGTNTLICRNSAANYTLTETNTGWLISSTTDGNDTISNVERLQFTDLNLALDTDAANSAGGIYRLYKAALDRNPDLGGLGYWIAQADAGSKDAVRMATDFTYADEFKALYGVSTADNYMTGEDITALVTKIYENVLDRAPDAGGRDYYAGQITTHSKTVGQVLAEISDSAENKLAVADLIGTGIEYTPWVD